jgi:hypothetical protein
VIGDIQIEGVMERSPTPVPLEERDTESLTAEEARELVRRLRTREENAALVKSEYKRGKRARSQAGESSTVTSGDEDDVAEITEAHEGHAGKRARGGVTIDLTED